MKLLNADTKGRAAKYLKTDALQITKDFNQSVMEDLEAAPKTATAPKTEAPRFNKLVDGFRPHEFSILCGSTGSGKTTLVANWALELIQNDHEVFVAPVEIGAQQFAKRVMSIIARDDAYMGPYYSTEKAEEFKQHFLNINTHNLFVSSYENRTPRQALLDDIAYMVEEFGVKVVFIDNINFILDITKSSEAIVEMDQTIHDLVIMVKRLPVHIVMVMHPKKTENGMVQSEFDIKGSSTAVQEAHNVFLFNRAPEGGDVIDSQGRRFKWGPHDRIIHLAKLRTRGKFVGSKIGYRDAGGGKYNEL